MFTKALLLLLSVISMALPVMVQAESSAIRPAHHDRLSLLSCSMPNAWYCQVLLRKKVVFQGSQVSLN